MSTTYLLVAPVSSTAQSVVNLPISCPVFTQDILLFPYQNLYCETPINFALSPPAHTSVYPQKFPLYVHAL